MIVEDTIHIEATPELVWRVTTDVGRWPEWTPTVTSVSRADDTPFGVGSVVRIKQPGQPAADWTVTDFAVGRRYSWETRRAGLRMTGSHEISSAGDGTKNVLSLTASGARAVLLWPILRIAVRRALADENRGLKAHCESISPTATAE